MKYGPNGEQIIDVPQFSMSTRRKAKQEEDDNESSHSGKSQECRRKSKHEQSEEPFKF